MSKIIGVVSGKGGTGKTISTLNIALALHQFGEDITVVDCDITASNIGLQLGYYSFPHKLQEVLNKEVNVSRATYLHHTGLKLIPSSISVDSINADVSNLKCAINRLDGTIILDSPPGFEKDALAVLDSCDEIIVVTNPEIPTVTNALKVIKMAKNMKKNVLGIVINKSDNSDWELTTDEIEIMCKTHVIGKIPNDKNVKKSVSEKVPIVANNPYSPASIEYKKIAAKLIGKTYEPPKYLAIKKFFRLIG